MNANEDGAQSNTLWDVICFSHFDAHDVDDDDETHFLRKIHNHDHDF